MVQQNDNDNPAIKDLAMLVRRLANRLAKHEPNALMIRQAHQYLKTIGEIGSLLR